jgi:hypothetical protein
MGTTRQLLERLSADVALRRICGWGSAGEIPHESKFPRAFSEFGQAQLPQRLHEALIEETQKERLIGHISRDSTEMEVREKPVRVAAAPEAAKPAGKKRGRPKKGEQSSAAEPTRLERQARMRLEELVADVPRECNAGSKKNSKGYVETWVGLQTTSGCS